MRKSLLIQVGNLTRMMRKLSDEEAREYAEQYGLRPVKIRGSDVVQLAKKKQEKFIDITWDEFFNILKRKRLAVYISSGGYMKIMSDDIYE